MKSFPRALFGPIARWETVAIAVIVVVFPFAFAAVQITNEQVVFASRIGIFARVMGTPLQLLIPLMAVGLGCWGFYEEVHNRFSLYFRSRTDVRKYLGAKLIVGAVVPFVVFACLSVIAFVVTFAVWPAIGDPIIDPAAYGQTSESEKLIDAAAFPYSDLLSLGPAVFGLAYSVWFGLGGALFGALGAAALAIVPNKVVAVLIPIVFYHLENLAAALIGFPYGGFMYSLVPFGLMQIPAPVAAIPIAALTTVVVAVWAWIFRNPTKLSNLL